MLGKSFNQPKKKEQKQEPKPTRARLEPLNCPPTIHDIRCLLAEAQKNAGMPCEVQMTTPRGSFLLCCQSDHLSAEPCWTLYDGLEGKTQIWNYLSDNLDMITDVVGMSVTNKDSKTEVNLPPSVALQSEAQAPAPTPAAAAPPTPSQFDPNAPYDPFGGWQNAAANQAPPPGPGQSMPGQEGLAAPGQMPSGWTQDQAGGWVPAQPWAPNAAQMQPLPYGADPMYPGGAPAPNAWQQDSVWNKPSSAAAFHSPAQLEAFAQSLDTRKNATLSELSMDPSVPPACLDLVLKLQEMVLKGHFNEGVALQALKLAALNGGILDDGVLNRAKAQVGQDPEEVAASAARLLAQAGLLSEQDILLAERNSAKFNNSFLSALLASRKVDQLLLDAAQQCNAYVSGGRIRPDQAIIALHYCARSRAKLKDALAELSIEVI